MRLQKFLSQAGICSRRAAEELVRQGRVVVNGSVVNKMGVTVDPGKDRVEVDGQLVLPPAAKIYLLLNKPAGYVTTLHDPYNRPTVKELTAGAGARLYPVGRLDMDTSGLLLLTNDGELAHRLAHPSFQFEKEYLARVRGLPAARALERLARGVELEDGLTAPAKVKLLKGGRFASLLSLTIHEGRNRQVRRMLAAVGHPVLSLKRVRYGPLVLAGLREGEWRQLTGDEVRLLKTSVNLTNM